MYTRTSKPVRKISRVRLFALGQKTVLDFQWFTQACRHSTVAKSDDGLFNVYVDYRNKRNATKRIIADEKYEKEEKEE